MRNLRIIDLGTIDYERAMDVQGCVLDERIGGEVIDTVLVMEHTPVLTLGASGADEAIIDNDFFKSKGISTIRSARGGQATFHSPGQLVVYPIIKLSGETRDVRAYIDLLENAVTAALKDLGVPAVRKDGHRGVWAEGRKIAFFGVAFRKWVTFHGVSINIFNDTTPFSFFDPCGEKGIKVASASEWMNKDTCMEDVKKCFIGRIRLALRVVSTEKERRYETATA